MSEEIRKLGLDVLEEAPFGTHLCQFYQTKEDLVDILVPYFKAGLENNEFCMWVTSEPLRVKDAKISLKKVVKNLDNYIENGQIEILDATHWYTKPGKFEANMVLQGWVEKENQAVKSGFDGLRLTGNTFWLEKRDWRDFADYEALVDNVIGKYRMIAICSYSLDKCGTPEVTDVVSHHQFVLIKQEGKWRLIDNTQGKRLQEKEKKALAAAAAKSARATIEAMGDGVVLLNMNGKITSVNPAFEKMTDYEKSELVGTNIFALVLKWVKPENLRETLRALTTTLQGKVPTPVPLTRISKEGTEIPISFTVSFIKDTENKPTSAVLTIKNTTELKRAEGEIRRARS